MVLNFVDVQSSFEHRAGFNLIFSILLGLVTAVIAPHSSPTKQYAQSILQIEPFRQIYIRMIVWHQRHTAFQPE